MQQTELYLKPHTLKEALNIAAAYAPNFRYIAGGTWLLVSQFQGHDPTTCIIDLSDIHSLKSIEQGSHGYTIGALVTLHELITNPVILSDLPALAEAAALVATPIIRRSATIGGNVLAENRCEFYDQSEWWRNAVGNCLKCQGDICIASGGKNHCYSKFSSDLALVLIAMKARVSLINQDDKWQENIEDIYTGNGVVPRNVAPTTLLENITIPYDMSKFVYFNKLRQRKSMDYSSSSVAVSFDGKGNVRLVLGALDPRPVSIDGPLEAYELLATQVLKKTRVVDNDVFSRKYRKEMASYYLIQAREIFEKRFGGDNAE